MYIEYFTYWRENCCIYEKYPFVDKTEIPCNQYHSFTLSNFIQSHTKTHKTIAFSLTQFDGNVPFQFVLETNSMHSRNGLNDRRFSMGYMTDGANVNCGLS